MKFTVTITDFNPIEIGWEVFYRVESEAINFTGVEHFEELPPDKFELSRVTAERVRAKMIAELNRLPG
jgi:hypothetical protein